MQESIGINVCDLGLATGLFDMTPKTQATEGKKNRSIGHHQNKQFLWLTGHQESENATKIQEKFANHISDKESVSRIYKELL